MKKQKQSVSYYDTKNKDEYISDEKNLKKIRNKSLRTFCDFVKMMEEVPLVAGIGSDKSPDEVFSFLFSYRGAERMLGNAKKKNVPDYKKMEADIKRWGFSGIKWMSKRTIYDYMLAYKFIKACRGREDRLIMKLVDGKKK